MALMSMLTQFTAKISIHFYRNTIDICKEAAEECKIIGKNKALKLGSNSSKETK